MTSTVNDGGAFADELQANLPGADPDWERSLLAYSGDGRHWNAAKIGLGTTGANPADIDKYNPPAGEDSYDPYNPFALGTDKLNPNVAPHKQAYGQAHQIPAEAFDPVPNGNGGSLNHHHSVGSDLPSDCASGGGPCSASYDKSLDGPLGSSGLPGSVGNPSIGASSVGYGGGGVGGGM